MKRVVLISSHCEDEEKVNVLKKNLNILRKNNIDTILYSTVNLNSDITELSTHYYFTKENPILKYPIKGVGTWRKFNINGEWITITHIENDYGWAGAYQYKNLLKISKIFDYDVLFLMIYDLILTEDIIDVLNNNNETLLFPSRHVDNKEYWKVGSHLICLNKNNVDEFIEELTIENYLSNEKYVLETFIGNICNKKNWNISDKIVEDEIVRYIEPFNRNHTTNNIKFYYINNVINNIYGILFFDVVGKTTIKVEINENTIQLDIEEDYILETEKVLNKLIITINHEVYDLTYEICNFSVSKFN